MRGMFEARRFRAECVALIVEWVIGGSVMGVLTRYLDLIEWSNGRCLEVEHILPLMGGEEGSGMVVVTDYEVGICNSCALSVNTTNGRRLCVVKLFIP